jgi:ERCC4-type nuclease
MIIQIDTREKARAIKRILKTFDDFLENDIKYISSKLYVGDYMLYGHPEVIIDRKQNLGELAGNICGPQHARFSTELKNAKEVSSHIVILIEDDNIKSFEDVKNWKSNHTKVKGETLYKAMKTMEAETDKYDVEFRFCRKCETGEEIIKILMEGGM